MIELVKENLGLIHVYTGKGKGKTSAALGLSLRAVGQGLKVAVVQFMKGGEYTGELVAARNFIPNIEFQQYGKKCLKEKKQMKLNSPKFDIVRDDIKCGECRDCFENDEGQERFAQRALKRAQKLVVSEEFDLLILDEINVAETTGFVKQEEIVELIEKKNSHLELVLTGRGAKKKVIDKADYVTMMDEVKHPFKTKKLSGRRGIEY